MISRMLRRGLSTFVTKEDKLVLPVLDAAFPYIWLRDACQSPQSVDRSTSQKLFRTSDIPLNIRPISQGVKPTEDGLHIHWSDGHKSYFSTAFLKHHATLAKGGPSMFTKLHRDNLPHHWDGAMISKTPDLFVEYSSLDTPSGMLRAINHLERYGLIFFNNVSTLDSSDTGCEVIKLGEKLSEIRETFYGRCWNVRNVKNSINIAYTNLHLGFHIDLEYLQHPPRYQLLHCLRNKVQGGQSFFADSFHAATILRNTQPHHFRTLTDTLIPFHYVNDGHHLHREHATIVLGGSPSDNPSERRIEHINYAPQFQAPFPVNVDPNVFAALRAFTDILDDRSGMYHHLLQEGQVVIFDNRRVLHAREAFTDIPGTDTSDGDTNRWLKGCYIEGDSLWDKGRTLRERQEKGEW